MAESMKIEKPERRQPSETIIRRGTGSDIEAAVAAWIASAEARPGAAPRTPERIEQVRGSMRRQDATLLIAEDGDRCVGMGLAMQSRADHGAGPPEPGIWFLSLIYVVPERWGEGIGGRLAGELLAAGRAGGYELARLWTESDNDRAQSLYTRLGFLPTGYERMSDGGEPITQFEIRLGGHG